VEAAPRLPESVGEVLGSYRDMFVLVVIEDAHMLALLDGVHDRASLLSNLLRLRVTTRDGSPAKQPR
jgi:hypothetical protein